jgi:multimeric flavodoxin WrbA
VAKTKRNTRIFGKGSGMKILGIAGSPRRGGNTDLLLGEVLRGAASKGAETSTVILLNDLKFIACQHCDHCLQTGDCKYRDDMGMVYRALESADRLVLASPIHFVGLTAQTKAMIDRCQALWARKYLLHLPPLGDRRERKGIFVSVGGRKDFSQFEPAVATVKAFFRVLDITYAGDLLFSDVDEKGEILNRPEAMKQAFETGKQLAE